MSMQPCPLSNPLENGWIPVYRSPVPNPQGQPPPPPDGWLKGTAGKYFDCDRAFPDAVYYHPRGWRNIWWGRTLSDDGVWGWVPEVFFTGGENDEPDFGLRECPSECEPPTANIGAELTAHITGGRSTITTRYGRTPLAQGRLTTASGEPLASATVCLAERRAHSGNSKQILGSVVTDANGEFEYRLGEGPSRRIWFVHRSGPTAAAASVAVRVRAPVSLRASRRSLRNGQAVSFHGAIGGSTGGAGTLVEVQVRREGRWEALLGTARTGKGGRFHDGYRFRYSEGVQVYSFRAHVPAQRGYPFAPGSSRPVRVRVRG
jgi:hypothetical protein